MYLMDIRCTLQTDSEKIFEIFSTIFFFTYVRIFKNEFIKKKIFLEMNFIKKNILL